MHLCLRHTLFCKLYILLVIFAEVSSGCVLHRQLLCLYIINHQLSNQWAKHMHILQRTNRQLFTVVPFRPFCHRATGGPEVAMGTGPWPQPPTEAEQLQALMAAANGESCTSSFSSSFSISSFCFQINLLLFITFARVCVGRLYV